MTEKFTIQQSLIHAQLNNKLLDILCLALMKNNSKLIKNKSEIHKQELHIKTTLDKFCDYIVIEYLSKNDSLNRTNFTLNLLTYNSKKIASVEMIFNQNNIYEEGSFITENEDLISTELINTIDSNTKFIAKNIF